MSEPRFCSNCGVLLASMSGRCENPECPEEDLGDDEENDFGPVVLTPDMLEWPFRDILQYVADRAMDKGGTYCLLCTQKIYFYPRQVYKPMVVVLNKMYTADDFIHLPSIDNERGGDASKMAYWGLIEEAPLVRPDGGRAGWWRITSKGKDFIDGKIKIPRYAVVFNSKCFVFTGPLVDVNDAYNAHFDREELMSGTVL